MCIGIFSFRAFDRRLARLAAPISSGVRQGGGGRICPPQRARSAEYPSGARVLKSRFTPLSGRLCRDVTPAARFLYPIQYNAILLKVTEV